MLKIIALIALFAFWYYLRKGRPPLIKSAALRKMLRRRMWQSGIPRLCARHISSFCKPGQMALLDGLRCEQCAKEAKKKSKKSK